MVSWCLCLFLQDFLRVSLPHHNIQKVTSRTQNQMVLQRCPRLDPRNFGHPNNRTRVWRIVYDKRFKPWGDNRSLQELADILLHDVEQAIPLDFTAYFTEADDEHIYETDLTAWCTQRPL